MLHEGRLSRRAFSLGGVALLAPARSRVGDLHGFIADHMRRAGIPGLAAAAGRDGRMIHASGHGFADLETRRPVAADTMFHIASITKTVTATAVMQLVERGRLGLDDDVSDHLAAPIRHPRHPDAPITIRQLLTHTSGISDRRYYEIDFREPGRDASLSLDRFVDDYLRSGGRHFSPDGCFGAAPGAAWDYSNVGYALLGLAAGRAGGFDMRRQTQRSIFGPLGMRRTSWTLAGAPPRLSATPYDLVDGRPTPVVPVGFPDWPAGMIRASAADLVRFAGAVAAGGAPILSRKARAEMLRMTRPDGLPTWLTGQGLGWQESLLDGRPLANHWGGDPGVFTAAYLDPERRTAAVVLTNTSATEPAKAAVKAIAARLLAEAGGERRGEGP
jgi:CubicO group peptidase (beta-lactamase class C family)